MSKISTKPPSGMRDFLPADLLRRRAVIGVVERAYEAHGFVPLETPTIENLSTLTGKYGEEGDQLMYRLLHRRDALRRPLERAFEEGRMASEVELADQGLRYDLTVPLARVVAQYRTLPRFFKRYQIQPVWRADRPGRGRFREFYQCDVDVIGTESRLAEAEVCSAVATALVALGFAEFTIHLNHRELLRAMVRAAGIDEALEGTALVAVDKLDKIGEEGVLDELESRGVDREAGARLLAMITVGEADMDDAAVLERLAGQVDARGKAAVAELEELIGLCAHNPAGAHLKVSPELARGLGYYTGPIFEIRVPDFPSSVGGGGRYDNLIGMFGKREIPAVGFSLGLERLIVVKGERGDFDALDGALDMMLCWQVEAGPVLAVATTLRAAGVRVEVFPEPLKLGKQLHYADAEGVKARFAGIIGERELAAGQISVKHLESGRQATLDVGEVTPARLAQLAAGDPPK